MKKFTTASTAQSKGIAANWEIMWKIREINWKNKPTEAKAITHLQVECIPRVRSPVTPKAQNEMDL